MFYSLTGNIDLIEENFIVLNCGGVGFKINTTLTTQIATQNEKTVTLYTHLNVKEDALDIYGFSNKQELSCFKMLISVSGIGPKAALSILCEMTPQGFAQAVAMGDYKALT
ncbi:MAG: Holliday junction branch migration protein RuvA, partial [Oscillospiraceae bacterium]